MDFAISVVGAVAQIVLGFYGFWLIWRFLLPYLPGPEDTGDCVAPFVGYFTEPFIQACGETTAPAYAGDRLGCRCSSSPLRRLSSVG